jgi:3-oxoacyl-[acyl-carrier protein] reductase
MAPHRALVTGGTTGIGRAVVRRLAREGHAVVAVYRDEDAAREDAAREFAEDHLGVEFERVDLSKPQQVVALFAKLARDERSPELLVNAAGPTAGPPVDALDAAILDAVLEASLKTTFLTCQSAVQAMTPRRFGRIINFGFASLAARPGAATTAQAASSAAVLGLTQALAREVGPFGITVNAIAPGAVSDGTLRLQAEPVQRAPLRRVGTNDEIAGLVNMLCADGAGYVTGQCISLDDGST